MWWCRTARFAQERTPSASSAPGDAKELGAEMAAKDLVSDITNKKEARELHNVVANCCRRIIVSCSLGSLA